METVSQPPSSMNRHAGSNRRASCRPGNGLMIAATVVGFIVWWPIGLALLAWTIWHREIREMIEPVAEKYRAARTPRQSGFHGFMARKPSNAALAEYLASEQERLRAEQEKLNELVAEFEAYKAAEREATDRQDFEAFLNRRNKPANDDIVA